MSKPVNIIGRRFGLLVVSELVGYKKVGDRQRRLFRCHCDCGAETLKIYGELTSGNSRSCGCAQHPKKHGESKSRVYAVWRAMRSRCELSSDSRFPRYGARGIQVCDRWQDYETFRDDMGPRPAGASIERIDVNGNYEPSNCRWATAIEQANNKRDTRRLVFQGEAMTLPQWARRLGVPIDRIEYRLRAGWSVEDALTKKWSRGERRDLRRKGTQ